MCFIRRVIQGVSVDAVPPSRLLAALARSVCRVVLRAAVTGLIFATCPAAAAAYLGVPLPAPSELLERFESVSQLSRILS